MPTETKAQSATKPPIASEPQASKPSDATGVKHSIFDACIPGAVPLEPREGERGAAEYSTPKTSS